MGNGLLVGVLWGTLLSVVLLVLLSLSAPLPEIADRLDATAPDVTPLSELIDKDRASTVEMPASPEMPAVDAPPVTPDALPQPAVQVDQKASAETQADTAPSQSVPLPAGSEFNRPPPQEPAVLPRTDSAPMTAAPQETQMPAPDAMTSAPAPDTTSAPQPLTKMITTPQSPGTLDATGALEPGTLLSGLNQDPLAPQAGLQPAPLGLPQIEGGVDTMPTPPATTTTLPRLPQPTEETVEPSVGDSTPQTVLPLPTIDAVTATQDADTAPAPEEQATEALPAITAHAAPFDAAETRPLMSIVLIDDPAFGMDRAVPLDLPFPVTFAIDPTRPGASEDAAAFRAAGFEIMILADILPAGAVAGDVEVALGSAMKTLPQAVGVLDTEQNRIQGDRPTLNAVINALSESGHGLVVYPRGLNVAEQSAGRVGVPAATLFRQIDAEQERATVIERYLNRAAFEAGQDGHVIVVGHTYPDTLTALFSWALGNWSENVALAPISAVLTR